MYWIMSKINKDEEDKQKARKLFLLKKLIGIQRDPPPTKKKKTESD